ncbi:MAG: NfeD family protein [Pyrinomonadaceae bacterium]
MIASVLLSVVILTLSALAFRLTLIAMSSRHKKSSTGELRLLNCLASVTEPLDPEGAVMVRGELWRARSRTGARVSRGRANVRVVGARGHLLEVEPV